MVARAHAGLGDLDDRIAFYIHQRDVVAVIGLVIVSIQAQALGADRMVLRRQDFRHCRIAHNAADFLAHELRSGVVRRLAHQQIGVRIKKADAAALGPFGFIGVLAVFLAYVQRRLGRRGMAGDTERRIQRSKASRFIFFLVLALFLGIQWRIAGRQAEIGGALKYRQMVRLAGDLRDHLHAGRSGSNHGNPLTGEIHPLLWPQAGMIPFALEVLDALEVRHPGRGQVAARHDAVLRADLFTLVRRDQPAVGVAIEHSGYDAGIQLNIAPQIEPVCHVVDVAQDFRLGAVAFRPFPLLLQFIGEGIGIFHALHIAARAGITVPEPGAANARSSLKHPGFQAKAAQLVQGVQPAQTAANHYHVILRRLAHGRTFFLHDFRHVAALD